MSQERRGDAENFDDQEEWEECGYEEPDWLESEPPASAGGFTDEYENAESSAMPLDVRKSCAFPEELKNQSGGYTSDSGGAAENPETDDGEAELRRTSSGEAASENSPELKLGFDGYGREIFIEKEDEHTGKPIIWYNYDSKKRVRRFKRDVAGILVEMVEVPKRLVAARWV